MHPRLVVLIAVLALPAAAAAQDRGTPHASLPAFRSDRDLARFLESLRVPPARPAPAAPVTPAMPVQPACTAPLFSSPPPAGTGEGEPAEEQTVITGRVTNAEGCPEAAVGVRIERLSIGATTGADGTYRLVIPGARILPGQAVQITASRTGLATVSRTIALHPSARLTQNFTMAAADIVFEDLVVTGAGDPTPPVTNNQHEGVDEGGIVKRHGDYLVILRRGRLFTVDVGGGGLRPVSMVNAFGPEGDEDAWYDEMLVSDGQVVVIGYSYDRGGTEIGLFRIDAAGRLHYRETYNLRSDDYYSSRNYASRLIGTRLVMYAPVPADTYDELRKWMPALRRWHADAGDDEFRRILRPERIYRPGRPLDTWDDLTLHTVTSCELGRGSLRCEATAVLGPEGRVFYVSPTAVYVWASEWTEEERAPSTVYRIPLDGSAPAALGVEGSPVDQFSFLESEDGHLNVLVRSDAKGEAMWEPEFSGGGDVRLLRVPIRHFGNGRGAARNRSYRALPAPQDTGYAFRNRFVGRHLLYGTGSGRGHPETRNTILYAVRWADGRAARVPLPHGVDRIEVMGPHAVVVGADSADLHFTGIRLDGEPRAAQRHVQHGAQQGELRSHGFFYRADAPDQGVIGLPIIGPGKPGYTHLSDESAAVLFLRNRDASFQPLGELEAGSTSTGDDDDNCIASCVDWYGNSRPIFLGDRILALMGYEIVEGAVVDGRIQEVRRASFAPPATVAAKR